VTLFQRAFPTQDGPLHLYYADVLANLLRSTGAYSHYYQIKHLFPPYAFEPYLLVALNLVFAPLLSEKLLVAIYIVGFCLGFRYLVHSVDPSNEVVPLFAVPLAMHKLLFMGFYNFCYGTAAALFVIGYWLRYHDRLTWRRGAAFLALIVLLASMHPVPLFITLLFIAMHLTLLVAERFRTAAGTLAERVRAALADSVRPIGYALVAASSLAWISLYTSKSKLSFFDPDPKRFKTFARLGAVTPFLAPAYRLLLGALIVCLVAAAAVRVFRSARSGKLQDLALPLMAFVCVVAYLVVPWEINNGAHFPERFPIFAFACTAAVAAGLRLSRLAERRIAVAVAAVVCLCIAWQAVMKHRIVRDLASAYDAPILAGGLHGAIVASVPINDRNELPYNFLPDYWAAAHYFRRAHADFLNDAWLDAPIQMLRPRAEGPCSYSDTFPMLDCLADTSAEGQLAPDVLAAANGGGDERPTAQLAGVLGMVRLPFSSPWLTFYARPDLATANRSRTGL
jgi:hypothetical protein